MLEEVVNSTVNRCLSPELMEPSVSRQYSLVFMLFHSVTRNNFPIDGSVELFENKTMLSGIEYGLFPLKQDLTRNRKNRDHTIC